MSLSPSPNPLPSCLPNPACPILPACRAKAGPWQTGAVLQPLGSAAIGAFKVHQLCGGFNQECLRLYDTLHERTVHFARMMDPKWLRSTPWAG